jgi:hypothetical protein
MGKYVLYNNYVEGTVNVLLIFYGIYGAGLETGPVLNRYKYETL